MIVDTFIPTSYVIDKGRYKSLIKECFGKIRDYLFKDRLKVLIDNFKEEIFSNSNHKKRFYSVIYKQDLNTHDISSRYIVVIFLLIAGEPLWNRSEHTVKLKVFDKVVWKYSNVMDIMMTNNKIIVMNKVSKQL